MASRGLRGPLPDLGLSLRPLLTWRPWSRGLAGPDLRSTGWVLLSHSHLYFEGRASKFALRLDVGWRIWKESKVNPR